MSATFRGKILNDLLQPAVVALAFPLYEQLHQIRALEVDYRGVLHRKPYRHDQPRRRHRPVAGRHAGNRRLYPAEIGHYAIPWPSRTRSAVFRRSAQSASFSSVSSAPCSAHTLFNLLKITTHSARGLAMGTASHWAIARCAEMDYQEGAFGSLALVICGIIPHCWRRSCSRYCCICSAEYGEAYDTSRIYLFHCINFTN